MGKEQSNPKAARSESDAALEREIRAERKFTLTEAIGRLAGPGSMKGASPVARKHQIVSAIETWLRQHLTDSQGALLTVMLRNISASDALASAGDQPLAALAGFCQRVLRSPDMLTELVRAADVEWGRAFGERPHFQKAGQAAHADDPYTVESVSQQLRGVAEQLRGFTPQ